jgi:hypothetical protein
MADSRTKLLLAAAAALAAVRLVIVPWVNQQVEQRQQLEVLTQRLDRSQGVVGNKDAIMATQGKLERQVKTAREVFPAVVDQDQFRLEAQRRITAIATQGGLTVSVFDWLLSGNVEAAGLSFGRVSVQFEGPLDKVIAVHGELEGSLPYAAIRELNVRLRSAARGPNQDASTATIVMDLFHRPVTAPAVPVGNKAAT